MNGNQQEKRKEKNVLTKKRQDKATKKSTFRLGCLGQGEKRVQKKSV